LLNSLLEYAQDIALILLILLICFFSGYVLLYACFKDKLTELKKSLSLYILIGFVGLFYYIKIAFVIGLLGILYIELLVFIALLTLAPAAYIYKKQSFVSLPALNLGHYFLFSLTLLLGLRTYFLFIGADDLSYHLPYARSFLENHSITIEEHLIYPLHTLDINILFSILLMLDNEFVLRLFNIFTISILAILIYDYLCQKVNCWLAILAPLVIFGSTKIMFFALLVYVDFAFSLFIAIGFIAFLCWLDKQSSDQGTIYLTIAALAVAAAASTKYFGLVFGFMLFIFILYGSKNKLKDSALFLLLCALFGSGWYLRNIIISGNPFHPFLSEVFGFYLWNSDDLAFNLAELKSHGAGKNLDFYLKAAFNYGFYPLISNFILLPLAVFLWKKDRTSLLTRLNLITSLFCLCYCIFWYQTARIDRYILPILSVACISLILSIHLVSAQRKFYKPSLIGISLLLSLLVFLHVWKENVPLFLNYPVSQFESAMLQKAPGYRLMQHANQLDLPQKRIYQVHLANQAYYYKGIAAGHWMGAARWSNVAYRDNWILTLKPAPEVIKYLKNNNYFALIIASTVIVDRENLAEHFNIVYEDNTGLIALPK